MVEHDKFQAGYRGNGWIQAIGTYTVKQGYDWKKALVRYGNTGDIYGTMLMSLNIVSLVGL